MLETIKQEIIDANGRLVKRLIASEITHGRKNTTHHFVRLIRLAIKLMKEEEGRSVNVDKFRKRMGKGKQNIRMITELFKDPRFAAILEYFRQRVFLEKKMPALIGVLDIKPSEKYVMQEMIQGFIYSLHHPEEEYVSWNLKTKALIVGDTSSVVKQIREKGIGYEEVMRQVNGIYESFLEVNPDAGSCSKYSNISYFYRNKLIRIFKELQRRTRSKVLLR